jgi:hypothetical protein
MADIVKDDERSIGPAAEDWMIQFELPNDRVDVVRPQSRVGVALAGLLREPVTPDIDRDQPVAVGESRIQLSSPGKAALRKAMDEDVCWCGTYRALARRASRCR